MAPVFGYWTIRGLAEPIRYILRYTGVEHKEEFYHCAPEFKQSDWFRVKFSLGLDFPNLPYYIDGDVKITQSNAILRYLGRKHGLVVTSEEGQIQQDMVEQQAFDLRIQLARLCYDRDFEKKKGDYLSNLPTQLKLFSDFLGKKPWILGDKLTYVDFLLYETFDLHRSLDPKCIDAFANLTAYMERFENLSGISSYRNTPEFVKRPACLPFATFGGK